MCTLVNQKGEKETKKNGAYLESQSTCVFSDQEIGQVHKVCKWRIEQQIPDYLGISSGKIYCDLKHIVLHQQCCRK